jgi:hypothetical protein
MVALFELLWLFGYYVGDGSLISLLSIAVV